MIWMAYLLIGLAVSTIHYAILQNLDWFIHRRSKRLTELRVAYIKRQTRIAGQITDFPFLDIYCVSMTFLYPLYITMYLMHWLHSKMNS